MTSQPTKENLEIARKYWRKWTIPQLFKDKHNCDFSEIIPWKKAGEKKYKEKVDYDLDIETAWRIELDRELGLICEPFLTTVDLIACDEKSPLFPRRKKLKGIRELDSANQFSAHSRRHSDVKTCLLEIDTNFSIPEIVESFRYWLENHCYPGSAQNNFGKGRKGRKDKFPGWFRELAIYRCDNAGIKHKLCSEAGVLTRFLKNLAANAKRQKDEKPPTTKITTADWSHAIKRTEKRIFDRMFELMQAEALSRGTLAKMDINAPWQKWLGRLR